MMSCDDSVMLIRIPRAMARSNSRRRPDRETSITTAGMLMRFSDGISTVAGSLVGYRASRRRSSGKGTAEGHRDRNTGVGAGISIGVKGVFLRWRTICDNRRQTNADAIPSAFSDKSLALLFTACEGASHRARAIAAKGQRHL